MLIGLDGGNNTTILALEEIKPIIVPTVYSPYKQYDNGFERRKKDLEHSLDVEIILNYNNSNQKKELGRYVVGELARKLEGTRSRVRELGKTKTNDDGLLICMLTTIALGVIKAQKKESGLLSADIEGVTGLPFFQFKEEKERNSFRQRLVGKHKVIFKGDYDIEVELNISDIDVDCEGAGSLNSRIFDENGQYRYSEDELFDRVMIGFDIGEFTEELIALTFVEDESTGEVVPEYIHNLCTGTDIGIANAKQQVIDHLRDNFNTIIDRYDIDKTIKRKRRRGKVDLVNGEIYDIMDIYESALKELAISSANLLNDKVKSANMKGKIKEITLFGGGPEVLDKKFGNYIRDEINEMLGIKPIIAEDPVTANARGYLEKAKVLYDNDNEE